MSGNRNENIDKVIICASWLDGPLMRRCTEKSCL